MDADKSYSMFEEMTKVARDLITSFTIKNKIKKIDKSDKSVVTECDKTIDDRLSLLAKEYGFSVVSEEGNHNLKIVNSGNYMTIDPIDGTGGYIKHVNSALDSGNIENYLSTDLPASADHCLLIGVVIDNQPRFGCCHNYVTGETIMLDSESKEKLRINGVKRRLLYDDETAFYSGSRIDKEIDQIISKMDDVSVIKQGPFGLRALLTQINEHENSAVVHRAQASGLWDILPACVASSFSGGTILDDQGNEIEFNRYIIVPGRGASAFKGQKFSWIKKHLKANPGKYEPAVGYK